jgi:hypothetical protein
MGGWRMDDGVGRGGAAMMIAKAQGCVSRDSGSHPVPGFASSRDILLSQWKLG